MTVLEIAERFAKYPSTYLKKGSGYLAKILKCSREDVLEAKIMARQMMSSGTEAPVKSKLKELSEKMVKISNEKGTLESTVESTFDPRNDIELAELHKVDLNKYKISNYWSKLKTNGKFTSSILCTLRQVEKEPEKQKDIILKELKSEFPVIKRLHEKDSKKKYAYEISIPDAHFGKLAWGEESGEDYDLKIAESRYTEAVSNLLDMVAHKGLDRIIFPVGNDMINIDSRRNETYAGTSQDSDSRYYKMVRAVKTLLIKTVNTLSQIAPVDIIVVSGNHDTESMFMIGEMLDAYYHNNDNVSVDNSAKQRKYYKYGVNGFQYTHGNEEKHTDLGLIFATEEKELWASTEFRFCKLGHYHKSKKMEYISVDEHQGFQVQILPSLSGSDAWHASKGYMSKKAAKGFLYHREEGQVGEFTHNVKTK